jgi:GntR family transcriptional regulator/MocR family aminotransferase
MWGIELERGGALPIRRQLYLQLKDRIEQGLLMPDDPVLSTRELAKTLNVSRNTVCDAYDLLVAEGYLIARQGAPTRVAAGIMPAGSAGPKVPSQRAVTVIKSTPVQPPDDAMPPSGKVPLAVSFRTGRPDLRELPGYLWQQTLSRACAALPREQYGYSGPEGLLSLREEIAAWLLRSRGLITSAQDIFITAGATHGLHLIADVLGLGGQSILIEDPCHQGMLQTFLGKGCRIIPVPADEQGLVTALLPEVTDARAVYVTPSHQFPLGGILPAARRSALVRYARENDLYIIEDDYDSEFRYSGEPVSPLHNLDPQRVLYVGTFSKVLFPALRVGYVIVPPLLQKAWRRHRTYDDVMNPPFEQAAVAELLRTRKLDRHIRRMRRLYGQRRSVLLDALKETFGSDLAAYGDAAGLHVAVNFPGRHFDAGFHARAMDAGIEILTVEKHCINKWLHSGKLLFGYGHLAPEEIRLGVKILDEFLNRQPE